MSTPITPLQRDTESRNQASLIGVLMLIQMGLGVFLNFFLLQPILSLGVEGPAAGMSGLLGFSTLLALALSSLNILYVQLLPRTVKSTFPNSTTLVIVFATAGFGLCAVEYVKLTEYVSYAGGLLDQFGQDISPAQQHLRATFASGRNEAHFLSMIFSSLSLLLFYSVLARSQLIAKHLGTLALVSCAVQLIAVGHALFDFAIPTLLQLPLLVTQVLIPIHLLSRGFNSQKQN